MLKIFLFWDSEMNKINGMNEMNQIAKWMK